MALVSLSPERINKSDTHEFQQREQLLSLGRVLQATQMTVSKVTVQDESQRTPYGEHSADTDVFNESGIDVHVLYGRLQRPAVINSVSSSYA
jgi:hypothetical protein